MKWKDSGEMVEKEEDVQEKYFDEEHYSPWAEGKDTKKRFKLSKIQILSILLTVAIIALISALIVLLVEGGGTSSKYVGALEQRLKSVEEHLDRYESIDEKVTAIWEQAKSFEKFKDRFDRSEASASLRMDHLTMSLEALQKELNEVRNTKKVSAPPPNNATIKSASNSKTKNQYHIVRSGDTFYSISKKYDLKIDQLLQMNQAQPDSVIMPGQKLIVRRISK
jgi:LysM repeat protein